MIFLYTALTGALSAATSQTTCKLVNLTEILIDLVISNIHNFLIIMSPIYFKIAAFWLSYLSAFINANELITIGIQQYRPTYHCFLNISRLMPLTILVYFVSFFIFFFFMRIKSVYGLDWISHSNLVSNDILWIWMVKGLQTFCTISLYKSIGCKGSEPKLAWGDFYPQINFRPSVHMPSKINRKKRRLLPPHLSRAKSNRRRQNNEEIKISRKFAGTTRPLCANISEQIQNN